MSRRLATTLIRSAFVIAVRAGSDISPELRSNARYGRAKTANPSAPNPPKSRQYLGIAGVSGVRDLARPDRPLGGLGAQRPEGLLEGLVHTLLDRGPRLLLRLRDLADQQELRA